MAGKFLISTGSCDGVYWDYLRSIVVRIVSSGFKFQTKEGFLRDKQEHDTDQMGIEFEVELVDIENEVARFFTVDKQLLSDLKSHRTDGVYAIGWKRKVGKVGNIPMSKLFNTAWEVER